MLPLLMFMPPPPRLHGVHFKRTTEFDPVAFTQWPIQRAQLPPNTHAHAQSHCIDFSLPQCIVHPRAFGQHQHALLDAARRGRYRQHHLHVQSLQRASP